MIGRIVTFSVEKRWLVLLLTHRRALLGAWRAPAAADRRRARHHQQPGADQRRRACAVARPDREAGRLHDRDRARRHSRPRIHPLAQPQRLRADHGGLRREDRHLLRAGAGRGAAAHRRGRPARRREPRDGADRHRAWRHLHVDGRIPRARSGPPPQRRTRPADATAAISRPRATTSSATPTRRPICAPCRTGSSRRS